MKRCYKCRVEKETTEFYKCKTNRNGIARLCKECLKKYYLKNRKRLLQYKKKWSLENRERRLRLQAEYRKNNPEANKNWIKNNPERAKEIRRKASLKYRPKQIKNYILRKHTDTNFRLTCNLRNRLNKIIRRRILAGEKNIVKAGSAITDMGCSIEFLMNYLESKFQPNMTWKNYGTHGWTTDHIIPLASFDITDREQFLKANHYTNLQPLWAADNIRKGNKILSKKELKKLTNKTS